MTALDDLDRAIAAAWQCAADACTCHDADRERRALAELIRLGELVPGQRTDANPPSL